MKSTLSTKVGVAISLVAFLGLPLFAQAQYGPPPGFEGMSGPPAGYENMTPPSGMPSGMPSDGQMGPPADVQEKMAKGLARLKKSAASMRRAIKTMEKAVAGAVGVGYVVPADITNSLAKANAAVTYIEGATSVEDDALFQAIDDFDSFTEVMDANIENLMLMTKFPRILKQADAQYVKLVKFLETTKARLVGLEADTTAAIAEVQAKVDAQKAFYDQAAALAKAGKMEEAFAMLEENFFPGLETTSQSIGVLNALKAITKTVSGVSRGIKTAEKIIAKLKSKKIPTAEVDTVVANSKAKLEELRVLLKTPGYDLEVAMALLQSLDELREEFDTKVEELIDKMDIDVGNLPTVKMFTGKTITVPVSLKGDFDNFKNKLGGFAQYDKPSDMFEFDMDSMIPEGVPEGYGF